MARAIKTTHQAVNSFVFLTPEEAFKNFGGGFSLVGRAFTPAAFPSLPPQPPAAREPGERKRKRSGPWKT